MNRRRRGGGSEESQDRMKLKDKERRLGWKRLDRENTVGSVYRV